MIDHTPLIDRIYEMIKEYNNGKYIKHSTQSNWQANDSVARRKSWFFTWWKVSEALKEFLKTPTGKNLFYENGIMIHHHDQPDF